MRRSLSCGHGHAHICNSGLSDLGACGSALSKLRAQPQNAVSSPYKKRYSMSIDPGPPAKKKSKLFLILGILGGGALLGLLCCGGVTYWTFQKGMEPFVATTTEMSANAELTEKLGTPIEHQLESIKIRNLTNNNGDGGADISFTAKGPKGTAEVSAKLGLTANVWTVEGFTAECSDGTTVSVPEGFGAAADIEAPAEQELVPQQ